MSKNTKGADKNLKRALIFDIYSRCCDDYVHVIIPSSHNTFLMVSKSSRRKVMDRERRKKMPERVLTRDSLQEQDETVTMIN